MDRPIITEKRCSRCREVKLIEYFGKRSAAKSGYASECKQCNQKQWRLTHPFRHEAVSDLPNEIWQTCSQDVRYAISNFGRVKRIVGGVGTNVGRLRKTAIDKDGYERVVLGSISNGTQTNHQVHRLVAFAFLGDPPDGMNQVNHIDRNPANNHIDNLEWCSLDYNIKWRDTGNRPDDVKVAVPRTRVYTTTPRQIAIRLTADKPCAYPAFTKQELESEEWREVPQCPVYAISNLGRLKRIESRRILNPAVNPDGYAVTSLTHGTYSKGVMLHRLVAQVFIGKQPFDDAQVNHKNFIPHDNRVTNLEWVTPKENTQHNVRHSRHAHGERQGSAVLNSRKVFKMRQLRRDQGITYQKLGDMFGVYDTTAFYICKYRKWKHVP